MKTFSHTPYLRQTPWHWLWVGCLPSKHDSQTRIDFDSSLTNLQNASRCLGNRGVSAVHRHRRGAIPEPFDFPTHVPPSGDMQGMLFHLHNAMLWCNDLLCINCSLAQVCKSKHRLQTHVRMKSSFTRKSCAQHAQRDIKHTPARDHKWARKGTGKGIREPLHTLTGATLH